MWHSKQESDSIAGVGKSIVEAHGGSFSALGQLLDHYRDYLLHIASEDLPDNLVPKVAPSDLVQETFLQAAKYFPGFRGTSEIELRAWLRQILIRRIQDAQRRYGRRQSRSVAREVSLSAADVIATGDHSLECQLPQPIDGLLRAEKSARVQRALAALPESYRLVIELRNFQRRSFKDIAGIMQRSPDAVRKLWCRGIEILVQELAGDESTGT